GHRRTQGGIKVSGGIYQEKLSAETAKVHRRVSVGTQVSRCIGKQTMNARAEDAATKILLAFEFGGIAPLEPGKFALVREHVRSILARAMENKAEKKNRKWAGFQRAKAEGKD